MFEHHEGSNLSLSRVRVYEGKSMHGMIEMVRRGEFQPGSKVLYAHLGGVPALNAYSFLFRNS